MSAGDDPAMSTDDDHAPKHVADMDVVEVSAEEDAAITYTLKLGVQFAMGHLTIKQWQRMLRNESPWPQTFLVDTFNSVCESPPILEESEVLEAKPVVLFGSPMGVSSAPPDTYSMFTDP